MCGIAGFVTSTPDAGHDPIVRAMTASLHHRGPDGEGYYHDPWASLGHRRLSIIDLASGAQPMTSESGDLWCTYNGEIFNHSDLRKDLEAAGHIYQTHCDTETILHAYEEYGARCVERFRGMFSFAVWNKNSRTLFCARDRLGKKPFYYYFDGKLFAFASEIKALLQHPSIPTRLDEATLPEYLTFGYVSSEKTLFAGIRKLMPGHTLSLRVEDEALRLETACFWELPKPTSSPDSLDEAAWIQSCRNHLEDAVQSRLMSDVPLGMFLSGGVDSSLIAALMRRMNPDRIKTFAVGYEEEAYSELGYARNIARRLDTDHHEVSIGFDDFFQALPRLIWHEDEPITWPSSVSLYFVSKLAASAVKVVLTGEGSDELFAGYGRYGFYLANRRWLPYYRALPAFVRDGVASRIATSGALSASLRRKLQHSFLGRGEEIESLYLDNFYGAFSLEQQRGLLLHPQKVAGTPYDAFLDYWNQRDGDTLLSRMLYADQKTYLVELLMKQDQMSMAASIESRVPFLDHLLVEFAATVPEDLKLRAGTGKYIVKKVAEGLLPNEIIYRRKMGFPTPLHQWLRRPDAAPILDFLKDREGLLAAYLRSDAVEDLLEKHRQGSEDVTDRIWRLLNLQLWGDIHITGRSQSCWPMQIESADCPA
jgi:asparagine synthase (glutamine-hydrolysing)